MHPARQDFQPASDKENARIREILRAAARRAGAAKASHAPHASANIQPAPLLKEPPGTATICRNMTRDASLRLLAAASEPDKAWTGILWFAGVVIALLIAALVAIKLTKRLRAAGAEEPKTFFDLEDLRKMYERGDLTKAEYEVLRQRTIAAIQNSKD